MEEGPRECNVSFLAHGVRFGFGHLIEIGVRPEGKQSRYMSNDGVGTEYK